MITEVNRNDFFEIINAMSWEEIKNKYGKLKIAEEKREPLFIVKDKTTGEVFKTTRKRYMQYKNELKFISRELIEK